jgi:hypothetical protein
VYFGRAAKESMYFAVTGDQWINMKFAPEM